MSELTSSQRRNELHRRLLKREPVIASQLAKAWGVTERTVRRDLLRLRDVDRVPVEYDRVRRTWTYVAPVTEVPVSLMTTADREAILFALRAVALLQGVPEVERIEEIFERLLATLPPEQATKFRSLMAKVHFTGLPVPDIDQNVWDTILMSLEDEEAIDITYQDGAHAHRSHRRLDPYGLVARDRRWILVARCHKTRSVRTFSLHRIESAELTDERIDQSSFSMDEYLSTGFGGLPSTGTPAKVVLKISGQAPPYVHEKRWHEAETRVPLGDGSVTVTFRTSALFALEREVLAEAPWVHLLEPPDARQRLIDVATCLLRNDVNIKDLSGEAAGPTRS